MQAVEFRAVTKQYHHKTVLDNINFSIAPGTFTVILGQPGSGKSVILRLLVGLEKPTSGQIFLRGEDVTHGAPQDRNLAYVPQAFALFPNMSVYDNIAYPLKLMGMSRRDIRAAVTQAAQRLRIEHLLDKRPDQCSGGEKQRVAVGRGIVRHTDIYVLDDPLAGLDFKLRERLFDDLKEMQQSMNATFVYCTSEPLEALMLADEIVVLGAGNVIDSGPIDRVYWQPYHLDAVLYLGYPRANVLNGEMMLRRAGQLWCRTPLFEFQVAPVDETILAATTTSVRVAVRPVDLQLEPPPDEQLLKFRAHLVLLEDLGGEMVVHMEAQGVSLVAIAQHDGIDGVADQTVSVGIKPLALTVFAAADGRTLGKGV